MAENSITFNHREIFDFIFDEFKFIENYLNYHKNFNSKYKEYINKYAFKGLFGLIFKYLNGVRIHIY